MAVYLNLQCAPTTYARRSPARVAVGMGPQMSVFQQHLSAVTDTITSLNIRTSETAAITRPGQETIDPEIAAEVQ